MEKAKDDLFWAAVHAADVSVRLLPVVVDYF